MLSKNNHKLFAQKQDSKKQKFKIKKLSVGVTSVLVGTIIATYMGDKISADTAESISSISAISTPTSATDTEMTTPVEIEENNEVDMPETLPELLSDVPVTPENESGNNGGEAVENTGVPDSDQTSKELVVVEELDYQTQYRENENLTAGETKVIQNGNKGNVTQVYDKQSGSKTVTFDPKTEVSVTREPQLIMVLVEVTTMVDNMYLTDDVSKLAPLWEQMEDGDRLLWISALRIPERFDNAKASYSVKGKDTAINPLERIGTIEASDIPARYDITDEDLKNAEIRLETDLFTQSVDSLVNNKGLLSLLNKAGSRVISIRDEGRTNREYKKYGLAEAAFKKASIPYKLDDQAGLLSVTPNLVPTIVYKTLQIEINEPTGQLALTKAQLKTAGKVIVLPVVAGKVQAQYTPESGAPLTIDYDFTGTATDKKTITIKVTAEGALVTEIENVILPQSHLETTQSTPMIIEVGTKSEVTTVDIPYETIYVTDKTMRSDATPIVLVEGKTGQKTITVNYVLDKQTGKVTAKEPSESITILPVTQQVKVGSGVEVEIPYQIVYQGSEELSLGQQVIGSKGKVGILQPNGVVTKVAMPEVILVGTKPTVKEEVLVFPTIYKEDPMSLPTDPERVAQVGENGKQITTTKYKVDPKTGELTSLEPISEIIPTVAEIIFRGSGQTTLVPKSTRYVANETLEKGVMRQIEVGVDGVIHPNGKRLVEAVTQVIEIGTRPEVNETMLEPEVIYEDDAMLKKTDPEVVVDPGKAGKKIAITTFSVDEKSGEVNSQTTIKEEPPRAKVIKRGIGEETAIAYLTIYEGDKTLVKGTKVVKQEGKLGIRHPNGTVTKEPVSEIIAVGTRPEVNETMLEPEVIYEDDAMLKKTDPEVVVDPGKAGKKIAITTFSVDEKSGEVNSQTTIKEEPPRAKVIKRGIGEETAIAYLTIYEGDKTLVKGTKVVKQEGKSGIRHPNGTVTKEPVSEIITVGTRPEVMIEELDFPISCEIDQTLSFGKTIIVQAGKKGQKIKTINYQVDKETGKLLAIVTEEVIAPVTQISKQGTKVNETTFTVDKEQVAPKIIEKAKVELPQTGEVKENSLALLGVLGLTSGLLLVASRQKKRAK